MPYFSILNFFLKSILTKINLKSYDKYNEKSIPRKDSTEEIVQDLASLFMETGLNVLTTKTICGYLGYEASFGETLFKAIVLPNIGAILTYNFYRKYQKTSWASASSVIDRYSLLKDFFSLYFFPSHLLCFSLY